MLRPGISRTFDGRDQARVNPAGRKSRQCNAKPSARNTCGGKKTQLGFQPTHGSEIAKLHLDANAQAGADVIQFASGLHGTIGLTRPI